jgi:hypothetical protein
LADILSAAITAIDGKRSQLSIAVSLQNRRENRIQRMNNARTPLLSVETNPA